MLLQSWFFANMSNRRLHVAKPTDHAKLALSFCRFCLKHFNLDGTPLFQVYFKCKQHPATGALLSSYFGLPECHQSYGVFRATVCIKSQIVPLCVPSYRHSRPGVASCITGSARVFEEQQCGRSKPESERTLILGFISSRFMLSFLLTVSIQLKYTWQGVFDWKLLGVVYAGLSVHLGILTKVVMTDDSALRVNLYQCTE
jgi:hypothetical protein